VKKEEEEHEEKEKEKAKLKAEMEAKGIIIKEEEEEYDIWRESLLRYLGYSNELGEALRPVLPAAYLASYAAAFSYVFADSVDKAGRAEKKAKKAAVRMAFVNFDKDGDGALHKDEMKGAFAELQVPFTDQQFDACFSKMDIKKNNQIDIEEFMAAYDRADTEIMSLLEAFQKEEDKKPTNSGPLDNPSLVAGFDALIWQTIASVALPGFTINRFVTLMEEACEGQAAANPIAEYFPTIFGLAMIPIICKPLDVLADFGLDATLRPLLFSAIDADQSGAISFEELKTKMQKMDAKFDDKYLRELFDDLDTNKDGVISIEEWRMGGYQKYKDAVSLEMVPP
jgi:Ca2+-binding EF-hand superfamily protein